MAAPAPTAVLNEIERRRGDVGYVKTADGQEVDFLVGFPAGRTELIQVCADPSNEKTRARELRALEAAVVEGHPKVEKRWLVLTRDQTLFLDHPGITAQPAYEWLLADL